MKSRLTRIYEVVRDHLGFNVDRIAANMTRKVYVAGSSVRHCDGKCCLGGTTVSVTERDAILAKARTVSKYMTSPARRDPSRWFGKRLTRDDDFTAGKATFTRVSGGGCVFLRKDRLCALQVAGEKELGGPYALKPSVCLLWPMAIDGGKLQVGYGWLTRRRECCAPVREGRRTILQVIGPDEQLITQMSRRKNSRGGGPPR